MKKISLGLCIGLLTLSVFGLTTSFEDWKKVQLEPPKAGEFWYEVRMVKENLWTPVGYAHLKVSHGANGEVTFVWDRGINGEGVYRNDLRSMTVDKNGDFLAASTTIDKDVITEVKRDKKFWIIRELMDTETTVIESEEDEDMKVIKKDGKTYIEEKNEVFGHELTELAFLMATMLPLKEGTTYENREVCMEMEMFMGLDPFTITWKRKDFGEWMKRLKNLQVFMLERARERVEVKVSDERMIHGMEWYDLDGEQVRLSVRLVPESTKHFFKELNEVEAKKITRVTKKKKK
ncbi:hypothetical protein ACFLT9_01975 [Acidobacteriota bacterium]